ncbi:MULTISPECIES: amino acid ABC transporter permease [Bartonella]|uniref:amino acid ABC transporter permease n=1 Tax=Bartonella TaxID=773 RepID=UPI0018DDAE44|nr:MULTISPECIES: amino acid ABC transporter permease [Bartonella]MBI0169100.1 amino acid ABC transporter permease [Bartonella sp. W8167]MBI0174912.1 amino acid ABC transporter permease [Bartonella apis]
MIERYVQTKFIPPSPPPVLERGVWHWLRQNLFSTPLNCVVSVTLVLAIVYFAIPLVNWLIINAVWSGSDRKACTTNTQGGYMPDGWNGACWAFVKANFWQFIYGRYPDSERWRVNVTALIVIVINLPLLIPACPFKIINALISLFVVPVIGYFFLFGGHFGLPLVETQLWGGLLVTLTIAYCSITISLPLGSLLALGRRSRMPVVHLISMIFIETVRGIPLVAVLFIASVMLPLFLPQDMTFDKFLRALIGVALFTSAYIAEVVRGGLQAIPRGQYEAAEALGLGYLKTMLLVILPQAYSLVIPGIINVLIGMFKETSLVYIIGMFDLLGIVRQAIQQAQWSTPQTPLTGMVFIGIVFWVFCFGMSRYAHFIERRLNSPKTNGAEG